MASAKPKAVKTRAWPTRSTYRIHPAKSNPDGWKWRLVLWLTGGEIEVVPLLPRRAIYPTETLVVRLGYEGALNTVELKHMVNTATELLWIDSPRTDLIPNTFVAVDVAYASMHPDEELTTDTPLVEQIVGTFINWLDADHMQIELPGGDSRNRKEIPMDAVLEVYYAPLGYRAPA